MSKNSPPFLLSIVISFFALAIVLAPNNAYSAAITVINFDSAGEGFNDATGATPVGGNTGTTVGQQRLIAFQFAADIWGRYLQSAVPIRVSAKFDPLPCTTYMATLGSAGPTTASRDFAGAPAAGTWYPIALANALRGVDLNPSGNHINATFSSNIGTPGCLENSGWYYGLDATPPRNESDFVSVLLHELGHGLGFLTFVDRSTGAKNAGYDDAYMRNLERHGAVPADFPSMTNAQRLAASVDTGNLHWTGANVRVASGTLSTGVQGGHVRMYAPNPVEPGSSVSHWDTALTPNQMMEPTYTNPIHTPMLELPLFRDIGWVVTTPSTTSSFPLNVTVNGSGLITGNPSGINCGSDCSELYLSGTNVTLTATPYSGNKFSGWSNACTGSSFSCVVNMNSAKSATATFAQSRQTTLSIASIGSGSGVVVRSGGSLNCGSSCTETLPEGSIATLTATPVAGSSFAGWSGGSCNGQGLCSFTLSSDTTIYAQFNLVSGGDTTIPLLQTNIAGAKGSAQYYSIDVPAGAKNLNIKISGGTGDADLHVKFGQVTTTESYDCRPYQVGNDENCTFPAPNKGLYYIMLYGAELFSGVTLSASYQINKSTDISTIINLLLLN